MDRDGSSSESKLALAKGLFNKLGGVGDADVTINQQARVTISYVAPAVSCGGPETFEYDCAAFCLHLRVGRDFSYKSVHGIPNSIKIADGFPKTVCVTRDGEAFAHHKLVVTTVDDKMFTFHLLTGGCVLPVWSELKPKAFLNATIPEDDEEKAALTLSGVLVDKDDLPEF